MVLNKRLKREFTSNWIRYMGLFLLVVLSVSLIVGFAGSTDSILKTVKETGRKNNLEDGHFQVIKPLTVRQTEKIKELGFTLVEDFYVEKEIAKGKTIRVFKERKALNLLSPVEGKGLEKDGEIVINQHFGETNHYGVGSVLAIDNQKFKVTGYGITPDYTLVLQDNADVLADPTHFGIGFIRETDFDKLEQRSIIYGYSFQYEETLLTDTEADTEADTYTDADTVEEKDKEIKNLKQYLKEEQCTITSFYKTTDNQRTSSYADDVAINKSIAMILGTILLFLLAFIFTLSSLHIIDKESTVIGALYALGYVKKDIIRHFMILPIFLVTLAALIGTGIGFQIFTPFVASSSYAYYSFPNLQIVYPIYLILFGIAAPIIITVIVNYLVLRRRLHLTPLKLLRKDLKKDHLKKIKLNHFSFINRFRIRVLLRGLDGNITLFCGLLFSTFLLLMGFGVKDSIDAYVKDVVNNAPSKYVYLLNRPVLLDDSDKGEKAVTVSLETYYSKLDQNMKITLQGIQENSKYFDYTIKKEDDGVYISKAVSKKFGITTGDTLDLTDAGKDITYHLQVAGILEYTNGLYAFMNDKQLNKLLGNEEEFFNTYFSNSALNINGDFIHSVITSGDITESAQNMSDMMNMMIILLISVAILLYIVIMYLLLKMIIDKSTSNISLVKIFGYKPWEINKIYLGSTFYTVLVSLIIAIPIDYRLLNLIWPECISNIQGFIFIKIKLVTYVIILLIAMASYMITQELLKYRLKKISYVDILKDRE